jgi:hypothetical protein
VEKKYSFSFEIKARRGSFEKKMSIFEALDVRRRIEHEYDIVDKLSRQYVRHTHEGPQCAACGTFIVGFEPRHRAPRRICAFAAPLCQASGPGPPLPGT